jgi:AraC-like DNA-binding protein
MNKDMNLAQIKENTFFVSEPNLPFTAFMFNDDKADAHWHTYIEFMYVVKGEMTINIGEDKYDAIPGDFYIANSQVIHSTIWKTQNYLHRQLLVIQFEPSVINSNVGSLYEFKYIVPFLNNEVDYTKYLKITEENELKHLLTQILKEFKEKNLGFELDIKGDLYKIFAWLLRNKNIFVSQATKDEVGSILELRKLLSYIDTNYYEPITMKQAAQKAYMSYYNFCRYFKNIMGKNFIEYLNFVRLKESEKLLISTKRSISEISMDVGFSSVSYFDKFFLKKKGVSPHEFRKQNSTIFKQK